MLGNLIFKLCNFTIFVIATFMLWFAPQDVLSVDRIVPSLRFFGAIFFFGLFAKVILTNHKKDDTLEIIDVTDYRAD